MADWIARLGRDRADRAAALDVAAGRGRHTAALVASGFRAFAVDIKLAALRDAAAIAAAAHRPLRAWCADLTQHPLPTSRFDLVVVARYLQRDLFPAIRLAVRPGGFVVYETFTRDQLAHGVGPTSPEHLLERGELRGYFTDWDVLHDEEVSAPEAVARLVARKGRAT